MLVIKRKVSEAIMIGDNIEIIISDISNDKVNICINAPKEIKITRKELLETQEFNENAASGGKYRNLKYVLHKENEKKKK